MPVLRVLVIFLSLVGFVPKNPFGTLMVPCMGEFQSKGGDVKPKMNYESEFIGKETAPEKPALRSGK
jgi:hypothetical protein